jgi:hypothetical protein
MRSAKYQFCLFPSHPFKSHFFAFHRALTQMICKEWRESENSFCQLRNSLKKATIWRSLRKRIPRQILSRQRASFGSRASHLADVVCRRALALMFTYLIALAFENHFFVVFMLLIAFVDGKRVLLKQPPLASFFYTSLTTHTSSDRSNNGGEARALSSAPEMNKKSFSSSLSLSPLVFFNRFIIETNERKNISLQTTTKDGEVTRRT